ncbi:UNVERIFIED_CONTAM: hypothetical protein Slati_0984400 [Sesamum latifolium]|uniref:Uncharacterized protein n=1 Tax=Sesamum latifolium TaxID=2727402 RepID=A0AAW2XU98_9LAMI
MKTRGSDTTSHEASSAMRRKEHRVASCPQQATTSPNSNTRLSTLPQRTDRIAIPNATAASNRKQGAVESNKLNTSFRMGFLLNRK